MKSVFIFIFFNFCLFTNAQDKIEADLPLSAKSMQTHEPIRIRCGSSINNKKPLFIIDGVPISSEGNQNVLEDLSPDDIVSISVLKDPYIISCYGSLGENGVVLIFTNKTEKATISIRKDYPFKVYDVCNTDWTIPQDMYNALSASVPGLRINATSIGSTPEIRMRGDDNNIVIVDGVRYDASILNTLNPADIESVVVAPSIAASNYLLNN